MSADNGFNTDWNSELPEDESMTSPQSEFGAEHDRVCQQMHSEIQALAGDEIGGAESLTSAQAELSSPLDVPVDEGMTNAQTEFMTSPSVTLAADSSFASSTPSVNINVPQEIRRAGKVTLGSAAVGGAAYGGLATYGALNAGATTSVAAGVGGLAAGAAAINTGLGALGLYTGGMLHNLVWSKEGGKQPGVVGTALRGFVSPLTVPAGVAYRFLRGK